MKTIVKWVGIGLGATVVLTALASIALYPIGQKKFAQTYPDIVVEKVDIPGDSDAVARGTHIAIVWGCTKCHGADLSGMLLANDPILGDIPAPNLTRGGGGIGKSYTDSDWIRAIRHAVKPNGRVEVFMYDYYATMSDHDLGDLIAYLKQIPPVDTDYPPLRLGPAVTVAPAIGMFVPAAELIDHSAPRPADPAPGATIEYGRYLSAICSECHSNSLAGKIVDWQKDDFVQALRTGTLPNGREIGPAMPSKVYGEMNDTELDALWLYLHSPQSVASH